MHPKVQHIIDQLKSFKPKKIILFGSYAYGQPKQDSDVDLLMIKKTSDPFIERQKKAHALLRTTTPVDVFVLTPEEFERTKNHNLFIKEIAETGKVIYG